jgi:predicted homoserine dehydrogenase-like protein
MTSISAPAAVALVGAGEFGATFAAQVRCIPSLRLTAVCDVDVSRAVQSLKNAGYASDHIETCDSRQRALRAIETGRIAVIGDARLLGELPLKAVVEATGNPEAAALVAEQGIASGFHVAMATKEAEVVVGPILAAKAREAGVVYTPVEGDQPSLLIGLIARARMLGFSVVACGKSTESDYILDPVRNTVTAWGRSVAAPDYARLFDLGAALSERLAERPIPGLATTTPPDLCEMTIVANHANLQPDRPSLHGPVARTMELPSVFRPRSAGGVLEKTGIVDVFTCLRRPDELSFAGGVFVVVEAPDQATGRVLASKGIPASEDGRYLLLHNPVHLLGSEAPASLLAAIETGRSTGGADVRQRFDLIARLTRNFAKGERIVLGDRHAIPDTSPEIAPAAPLQEGAALPYYLAPGSTLKRDVRSGQVLQVDDVDLPDSTLKRLRGEQDDRQRA